MNRKKMFGVIPYVETNEGDRLTHESAVRTVQVGIGLGAVVVALVASRVYPFIASNLGSGIGLGFVAAMLFSWGLTTFLAYDKVVEKVVQVYKDKGEYIELQQQD